MSKKLIIKSFLIGVFIGLTFLSFHVQPTFAFPSLVKPKLPKFPKIVITIPPIPKITIPPIGRRLTPTPTVTNTPTPTLFSDNFDDGNADRWWLGYSQHAPWIEGNWRIEDGKLIQDQAGDDFIALVKNIQISNQTIETQLKLNGSAGYGGVTFWYKDNSRVSIIIYPAAGENGLFINEVTNGITKSSSFPYQYHENTWYILKVNANNITGELAVYIDNVYLFTYIVNTNNRIGQSGVNSGNSGGYFDNFSFTSPSPQALHYLEIEANLMRFESTRGS